MSRAGASDVSIRRGAIAAGIALLLLIPWIHPTVMFADDGELVRAIWENGLAHPPGSPLYLSVSEPFTLLPFGSVAFRAHLASAAMAAVAVGAAFALAAAWGSGTAGASLAAGILLFAPIFWQQARLARPYPLQAAATLLLFLILRRLAGDSAGDRRLLPLLAFAGALSLGAHQLMLVPAVACLAAGGAIALLRRMPLAGALPPLALGGLIWLHLPLRSVSSPISAWVTSRTADEMLFHITHRQFAGKLTPGAGNVGELMATIGASLPMELTPVALGLAFVGVVALARRRTLETAVLVAVAAVTLLLRSSYIGVGEVEFDSYRVIVRYLLGLYALAAVAAGIGWGAVIGRARRAFPSLSAAPVAILTASLVVVPAGRAAATSAGYPSWVWHDRNRAVLLSSAPKALIVANNDDIIFPLWYLQDIGGYAPDTYVFGEAGLLMPWAVRELSARASRALRTDGERLARSPSTIELIGGITAESGVRVASTGNPPGVEWAQRPRLAGTTGEWGVRGAAFLRLAPGEATPAPDAWRAIPLREPAFRPSEAVVPLGEEAWFLTVAARRGGELGDQGRRLDLLRVAATLDPGSWVVHNDLGLAYAATGRLGRAEDSFREAARLAPWEGTVAGNLAIVQGMRKPGARAGEEEPR